MMRYLSTLLFFLTLPTALFAQQRAALNDFEAADVVGTLTPLRTIELGRAAVEGSPAGVKDPPAGFALSAKTAGQAGVFSKPGAMPDKLLDVLAVELWIYRPAKEAERGKSTIEVQFIEEDGRTKYWHKVELDHAGWQKQTLHLKWFRWGEGRIPQWQRVRRWGVWFRDAADLQIDNVALVRSSDPDAAVPQTRDYLDLAFPGFRVGEARIHEEEGLAIVTNSADVELDKLAAHLKKVQAAVEADLGKLSPSAWPATLVVTRTREQHAAFPPRLAQKYGAQMGAIRSDGFTVLGVSSSYYDARQGTLRPVYTHEFVHSVLSRTCGLDNAGEWFQEGLASRYQLQFHPQKNFAELVKGGIADPAQHDPLEQLASGKKIEMSRYWQAATLCDLLVAGEKYKAKFPALLAAFRENGKTDLAPHREKMLGVSWEELTTDWKKHCTEKYAK